MRCRRRNAPCRRCPTSPAGSTITPNGGRCAGAAITRAALPDSLPLAAALRLLGAVSELLFLDGEHAAGLDRHVAHDAGASAVVGKLHVVAAGRNAGDAQALVVVDLAVAIVLALVRTPLLLTGRRQVELLHRVGCQVPEPDAFVLCGRRSRE